MSSTGANQSYFTNILLDFSYWRSWGLTGPCDKLQYFTTDWHAFRITVYSPPRALPFRTTSVASDEPLCIMNLFNWDVMQVLRSPEETRTEKLSSLLSEYPPEVICCVGKKLRRSASRWALASFLRQRASVYHRFSATTPAHLTSKGLTEISELVTRLPEGRRCQRIIPYD
jgi:hypothetical protein